MPILVRATLIGALFLSAGSLIGCSRPETLWQAKLASPDGQWIASARTAAYGGGPTATVLSEVYLQRTKSSEQPFPVLAFGEGPSLMKPQFRWLAPHELEVSFRSEPHLDTQVVKYAGVNIVVKVRPSESTSQ
jgi:hypothetical protein